MKTFTLFSNILFLLILLLTVFLIRISSGNFIVLSGSMSPRIPAGSWILIRRVNNYKLGDVVSFNSFNATVTHRIVGIDSKAKFITKGDANSEPDQGSVDRASILGKTFIIIPYLGYLISFSPTLPGLIIIVLFPAMILIYFEIRNIFSAFNNSGKFKAGKARHWQRLVICFLLIFLTNKWLASGVLAFLSSVKIITGNTITVSSENEPPVSNEGVIINEIYSGVSQNYEWVELFNNSPFPVNLSGWNIADGDSPDTFLNLSDIPAFGYAVVISASSLVSGIPAEAIIIRVSGYIGSGLNNEGDSVNLTNDSSELVDTIIFGPDTPVGNPTTGQSLARIPNGIDSDSASDWQIDSSPTLGTANSL